MPVRFRKRFSVNQLSHINFEKTSLSLKWFSVPLLLKMILNTKMCLYRQGFGREKDENRADLCLRSIVFSFESGRL